MTSPHLPTVHRLNIPRARACSTPEMAPCASFVNLPGRLDPCRRDGFAGSAYRSLYRGLHRVRSQAGRGSRRKLSHRRALSRGCAPGCTSSARLRGRDLLQSRARARRRALRAAGGGRSCAPPDSAARHIACCGSTRSWFLRICRSRWRVWRDRRMSKFGRPACAKDEQNVHARGRALNP